MAIRKKTVSARRNHQPTDSGYRSRELEWRRDHGEFLRSYAGQWVVLEDNAIVANGNDLVKAVAQAREKGIEVPYVFYVDVSNEEVVEMGI